MLIQRFINNYYLPYFIFEIYQVTETKLKEHFSTKGVVTDVQLKYTKDGKFRRFGFVGFKTDEQANEALEYFDKTCIDTTRISVQLCAGLGNYSLYLRLVNNNIKLIN